MQNFELSPAVLEQSHELPMPALELPKAPSSPEIVTDHERNLYTKIGATLRPVIHDIQENDHKVATSFIGAGLVVSQVLDRSRFAVIIVPKVGTTVLEHTQNPVLTGLAAAGANFAWTNLVGEFTTQGLVRFPKTVEAFTKKFPKFVDFFQSGLPGLRKKEVLETEQPLKKGNVDHIKSEAIMHTKRSVSGMGLGSTAFVATASTLGYNERQMRRVNLGVSLDTSALVFGAGWGLGKYVMELTENGEYEKVQTIQSWVGNSKNWLALAGALMVTDYTTKKLQARKDRKLQESEAAALVEANRTRLPEKYSKEITTPRAWLAVGAVSLLAARGEGHRSEHRQTPRLSDVVVRTVVRQLNKKGTLNIPK